MVSYSLNLYHVRLLTRLVEFLIIILEFEVISFLNSVHPHPRMFLYAYFATNYILVLRNHHGEVKLKLFFVFTFLNKKFAIPKFNSLTCQIF